MKRQSTRTYAASLPQYIKQIKGTSGVNGRPVQLDCEHFATWIVF